MSDRAITECSDCGGPVVFVTDSYRYSESGLSTVVLQNAEVAECGNCGNTLVLISHMEKLHRAIAQALVNSPARLTGEQLRFLRKHLGLSGDQLGRYLHTDKTKISKWERGEDPIGAANDRLIRLVTAALNMEMRTGIEGVAEHLLLIEDGGKSYELYVDARTLQTTFFPTSKAA